MGEHLERPRRRGHPRPRWSRQDDPFAIPAHLGDGRRSDRLQRLPEQPGFAYARYEATTPDPADPKAPHKINFPRVLPQHEINRLLDQINSPVFQEMMLWNRLPDKTASRFRDTWFETCLRRG